MVHCGDILENRERERLRDLFLIYILFTKTGVNRRFVFFCSECVCEHIPDPDRSQQADRGRSLRLRSCQVYICRRHIFSVLWIQIHWNWIWILKFGPIWIRIQVWILIQDYVINFKRKIEKMFVFKQISFFKLKENNVTGRNLYV